MKGITEGGITKPIEPQVYTTDFDSVIITATTVTIGL